LNQNNIFEEKQILPINIKVNKRGVSNLDAYIDLILKNGVSMEEFLYLIRNNPDDPYDLEITEYGKII
jgi:hypothetical protein